MSTSHRLTGWGGWDQFGQDLRAAWRTLRRNPAFTIVAVLSLGLGIGANTAIFSLIDTIALRKLPVADPDRLVRIVHIGARGSSGGSNAALLRAMQDQSAVFTSLFQVSADIYKVRRHDAVEAIYGQGVSGDYYTTLGIKPFIGRTLTPADDTSPTPNPVVVLGYDYWRRQFDSNPNALGQTLVINGTPHTIVGVTPPDFFGIDVGSTIEVTVPLTRPLEDDRDSWLGRPLIGRLKPDVTPEQARANVDAIFQSFMAASEMSARDREIFWRSADIITAAHGVNTARDQFSQPLIVLTGIVALVLLLACANLAGLLLARGVARQREMAVRSALGAGRGRLARLLMTESLLLATLGAALGLLLARYGVTALLAFIPDHGVPLTLDIEPNARILAFSVAIALLTGLLLGVAPLVQLSRARLQPALADGGRTMTHTRLGAGRVLVIAQVAMSLVLIIGALLLVRSLRNLNAVDAGFARSGDALLFTIDTSGTDYDYARLLRFNRDLLDRLRALPGVDAATSATITPLNGADEQRRLEVPGFTPRDRQGGVHFNYVSGAFFDTFGVHLLRGRAIRDEDDAQAPGVAVVSTRFAQKFFGDEDPIGHVVLAGGSQRRLTIVGVVNDVRHADLRVAPEAIIYIPLAQRDEAPRMLRYAMRTTQSATALMTSARRAVYGLNPDMPVLRMKTFAREIDDGLFRERLLATLSGFFGLVALLLATIGLYGLLAYAVSRRTSEIGVRLALGATRGRVLWMVCRECLALAGVGTALGLAGAFWATRLLGGMLFGLAPTDGTTMLLGAAVLLAIAALAGLIPARRAALVDPLTALRHE